MASGGISLSFQSDGANEKFNRKLKKLSVFWWVKQEQMAGERLLLLKMSGSGGAVSCKAVQLKPTW